jgi:hypothetical protein
MSTSTKSGLTVEQINRFKAEMFWRLHAVRRLRADEWEEIVAYAVRGKRNLSDNYLGDVVAKRIMFSVKSIYKRPRLFKKKPSEDISLNPVDSALAWERRIQTDPSLDLDSLTATEISEFVLADYKQFEEASLEHYGCDQTLDFCIIHGENITGDYYIARLIVNRHNAQLGVPVTWRKKNFSTKSKNDGLNFVIGEECGGRHDGRVIFKWTTPNSAHTTRCLAKLHAIDIGKPTVVDLVVPIPKVKRPTDQELLNACETKIE